MIWMTCNPSPHSRNQLALLTPVPRQRRHSNPASNIAELARHLDDRENGLRAVPNPGGRKEMVIRDMLPPIRRTGMRRVTVDGSIGCRKIPQIPAGLLIGPNSKDLVVNFTAPVSLLGLRAVLWTLNVEGELLVFLRRMMRKPLEEKFEDFVGGYASQREVVGLGVKVA